MSKFIVLYRSTVSAADQMATASPETSAASMQSWMDWGTRAGDAIVDFGSPTLTVADPGDAASFIGGYAIFQADTLADLQSLLADHPHRRWGTIEILELLPIPGM